MYHRVYDFRSKTKVINFGIAYGLSAWSLAERFKIPQDEAEKILDDYFTTYFGIKRWLDSNSHESIALRYSKTILGRKRYYTLAAPDDDQAFRRSRNATRRAGNNAVIQGTNADITKEAMNKLQRVYDNIEGAKLLFTVHDEIVSEVPENKAEEVAEIKAEVMRQAFHRFVQTVPVGTNDEVGVTIADHWNK
jgi:DNA polymerase-1